MPSLSTQPYPQTQLCLVGSGYITQVDHMIYDFVQPMIDYMSTKKFIYPDEEQTLEYKTRQVGRAETRIHASLSTIFSYVTVVNLLTTHLASTST